MISHVMSHHIMVMAHSLDSGLDRNVDGEAAGATGMAVITPRMASVRAHPFGNFVHASVPTFKGRIRRLDLPVRPNLLTH